MAQNWTSIVESNWIFSKFYLLIYIYIVTYKIWIVFSYTKKKAHKYKINSLSLSNFIYSVKNIIMFFYDLFILDFFFPQCFFKTFN